MVAPALAIGIVALGVTGCGGGSNGDSVSSEAKEEVKKGFSEAEKATKQGAEQGKGEAKKAIENAKKETQEGIEKGKAEAEKGIEQAEKQAQKYGY